MPTVATVSHRFVNTDRIVTDLLEGQNAAGAVVGFLVCDYQLDTDDVVEKLSAAVDFPIVGGTTMAFPMAEVEDDVSAQLVVYCNDGASCAVAVSAPLDEADGDAQMTALYRECVAGAPDPKMFYVMLPLQPGVAGEHFVAQLFQNTGAVPAFGGTYGADVESGRSRVFAQGRAWGNRMVLLALAGDVQPVFAVANQLSVMSDYVPTVTRSKGNIVYTVDDMPFISYLRQLSVTAESGVHGMDALLHYGTLPVVLKGKLADDDGVLEVRDINGAFEEDGSVSFACDVPEGARVSVGTLQKSDIVESAERGLEELARRMEKETAKGRAYSLLLCVPCATRYLALVGGPNLENTLLKSRIPKGLAVSTFYAFGEVAPTFGKAGEVHNRTHNKSIVLCAL